MIPNGDPAERMAGRTPTETEIDRIRAEWGFDDSLPSQYVTTMEKVFTGDLASYFTRLDVVEEIVKGIPATFSLAIGAAILWMITAVGFGLIQRGEGGQVRRPRAHRARADRHLHAGVLDRRADEPLPRLQGWGGFPTAGTCR